MPYTSPRPRLRPLNLARLETETETVLHKVFMPVTSSMVKVYIRDRVRDRDLENGLYESETETETLESRDTRDETRVSSVSDAPQPNLKGHIFSVAIVITYHIQSAQPAMINGSV